MDSHPFFPSRAASGQCILSAAAAAALAGVVSAFAEPPQPPLWDADLSIPRRKAAKQKRQNKKLFSDIAIGAFRCDRNSTPCNSSKGGAHPNDTLKITLQNVGHIITDSHLLLPPPPPAPAESVPTGPHGTCNPAPPATPERRIIAFGGPRRRPRALLDAVGVAAALRCFRAVPTPCLSAGVAAHPIPSAASRGQKGRADGPPGRQPPPRATVGPQLHGAFGSGRQEPEGGAGDGAERRTDAEVQYPDVDERGRCMA